MPSSLPFSNSPYHTDNQELAILSPNAVLGDLDHKLKALVQFQLNS